MAIGTDALALANLLILLGALLVPAVGFFALLAAGLRLRVPAIAWTGVPAGYAVVGALAALGVARATVDALPGTVEEAREPLVRLGEIAAVAVIAVGSLAAAVVAMVVALGLAAGHAFATLRRGTWTPAAALGAGVAGGAPVVALVVIGAGTGALGAGALVGLVAVLSLREAEDADNAAVRATLGLLGACAVVGTTAGLRVGTDAFVHLMQAVSGFEMPVAYARILEVTAPRVHPALALAPVLAGLAAAFPVRHQPSVAGGVGLAAAVLSLGLAGAAGCVGLRAVEATVGPWRTSFAEVQTAEVAAAGIALPVASRGQALTVSPVVRLAGRHVLLRGRAVGSLDDTPETDGADGTLVAALRQALAEGSGPTNWGELVHGHPGLQLEADAATTLGELRPLLAAAASARLVAIGIVVERPEGLGVVQLRLEGAPPSSPEPEAGEDEVGPPAAERELVWLDDVPRLRAPDGVVEEGSAQEALSRLVGDGSVVDRVRLTVRPDAATTLQRLVAALQLDLPAYDHPSPASVRRALGATAPAARARTEVALSEYASALKELGASRVGLDVRLVVP